MRAAGLRKEILLWKRFSEPSGRQTAPYQPRDRHFVQKLQPCATGEQNPRQTLWGRSEMSRGGFSSSERAPP